MSNFNLENLLNVCDLWETLSDAQKPIFLYGMGDGADKILNVCESKNIKISGVFASDDFVRGQSFRGFTVKKYSDIKAEFNDIIILISFASSLETVLHKMYALTITDEVYAPDVPVFGEGLFDSNYFNANFDKFNKVYTMLEDETSKKAYYNIIKYKLTGDIQLLKNCETDIFEAYKNIIQPKAHSVYADIGAYTGDTIKEYTTYAGKDVSVYAFEPDEKNFRKLSENVKKLDLSDIKLYNIAAWNKKEELVFYSRSGRNSAHTTSHKNLKSKIVYADRADAYINTSVDYINIDAEGSDLYALDGLSNVIKSYQPTISCAVYHRNEDMFEIPLYLASKYNDFEMYIRHFPYVPAWDTNVYIRIKKTGENK